MEIYPLATLTLTQRVTLAQDRLILKGEPRTLRALQRRELVLEPFRDSAGQCRARRTRQGVIATQQIRERCDSAGNVIHFEHMKPGAPLPSFLHNNEDDGVTPGFLHDDA